MRKSTQKSTSWNPAAFVIFIFTMICVKFAASFAPVTITRATPSWNSNFINPTTIPRPNSALSMAAPKTTPMIFSLGGTPIPFPFLIMFISSLFRPSIGPLDVRSAQGDVQLLNQASDAFVEAFWVGKGGRQAKPLSKSQRVALQRTQFSEFRKRYAGVGRGEAELVLCRVRQSGGGKPNADENLVKRKDLMSFGNRDDSVIAGCAGIETTEIPKGGLKGPPSGFVAPLMSNVAVSRSMRRRGIAQKLVAEVERICRYQWGYDTCYLYVEQGNGAAVKLYRKLGYRQVWVDKTATTLMPKENGSLVMEPTTIVCMKKRLDQPDWVSRLLPF